MMLFSVCLTGCNVENQYQLLNDHKDNIYLIQMNEAINDSLNGVGEIASDITAVTDKRYQFIIFSEAEAEKIVSHAHAETIKNKINAGYVLIYYQQDRMKLNSFLRKFYLSRNLEADSSMVLAGCILHLDINYALQSKFVNGYAVFYNTDVSATHFVKSQMQEIIRKS